MNYVHTCYNEIIYEITGDSRQRVWGKGNLEKLNETAP